MQHLKDSALALLNVLGSIASILGAGISLYVLRKERDIEKEVNSLKTEEENWHDAKEKNNGKF